MLCSISLVFPETREGTMKTRRATLTTLLAAAALALSACAGAGGSAQSNATTQETGASATRTITDHGGNEVTLPEKVTRVAIDQIPIESTYLAYFDGKAPYLVGMSAARVKAMSQTIAAEMAPEMMQVDTSYYDKGELNAEALLNLNVDVVLYNAFNKEHGEMFRKAGIPAVGFTTMGNPSDTYTQWMELLEDVFNQDGHMADKISLGQNLIADARARTAKVPEDQRVSTMVLMGAADGQLAVAGGKDGWFTNEWADSLNYVNVTRDTDTSHTPVTFEQVLTWDPQVLLVTGKGMSNMTAHTVLTNSVEGVDLSTLSSVKSGRVYSTGLGMWNWFTPNPDAPIVANWIGASLYPDQFSDVDLVTITKDYYQKMYNFTLTDEQARRIVNPDAS